MTDQKTPADDAAGRISRFLGAHATYTASLLNKRKYIQRYPYPDIASRDFADLTADDLRALLDERDRLRRQLDAAEAAPASVDQLYKLLADLVPLDEDGQDACWFDHHGGCQAHGYLELKPGERCPVAETRELLAGRLSPDAEP